MNKSLHILNKKGLEEFETFLQKNHKKTNEKLPNYLLMTDTCYSDTKICVDLDNLKNLDLWEIGKNLVDIMDKNPQFLEFDFEIFWASMSLHFANVILLPDQKILEWRRYIPDVGFNRYKHLLYSAYLCYKTFGEDSKFILCKNNTHNAFADKFLGRSDSYRYAKIFPFIKKLYLNTKISSKKDGNFNDFMKFIKALAINHSLLSVDEKEFETLIPQVFKDFANND